MTTDLIETLTIRAAVFFADEISRPARYTCGMEADRHAGESDESLPLAPLEDVQRPVERQLSTRPAPRIDAPDLSPILSRPPRETSERQFSLLGLMLLFTLLPLLLLPMGKLPRPEFAGVAGGLSLLLLILDSVTGSRHMLLRLGWWGLFTVYLTASLFAALGW